MKHYNKAVEYVKKYLPDGGELLDVGGGVGAGYTYLEQLSEFRRTSIELTKGKHPDVRVITADFRLWFPNRQYDVALCLGVLEQLHKPVMFVQKLFDVAPLVIVSVPNWRQINEKRLRAWTGREPVEKRFVDNRLVAVYKG